MTNFLTETFLFQGVSKDWLEELIKTSPPIISEYKRGEQIYSSASENRLVGFVLKGECEIRRHRSDGSRVVLNSLGENESFGILSVFSDDEFPTHIFAVRNSSVLYFTDAQIKHFVNNNSQIATNLINFLVGRVGFLNKKIATFSGIRVEDRLAAFLLCESDRQASDALTFNCQKTAEEINAGRASVYRALSSLEEEGFISIVDKKIHINDRKGLERIVK